MQKAIIKKALASVQAYLPEDKEIVRILEVCDFYPINDSFGGWKEWINYSHKVTFSKDKKIRISKHNSNVKNTDLYAYSNILDIAEISKKLLLKFDKNRVWFLFLGGDDRIRLKIYSDGFALSESPLTLPLVDIRALVTRENFDGFVKIGPKTWVSTLPVKKKFLEAIKETETCKTMRDCSGLIESLSV